MSLSLLLNRPCTIVGQVADGTVDEYGGELIAETRTDTVCELQQAQRSETDQEVVATRWTLFLPAGTQIDAGDRVIVETETFEVDGQPWPARNPRTGQESHIEATVVRTEGTAGS
jgi:hypothetical protein